MAMIIKKYFPRGTAKFGRFCVKVREERLRWKHRKLVLRIELPNRPRRKRGGDRWMML